MAMYHLSVKYVSRGQGRSSVGAAAYRAGEKLHNDYDGQTHDFTHKQGIIYREIMLPENAPREYLDRQTLWNAVEAAEKRRDARTAREVEIALPHELSLNEQIELVGKYARDNFISAGMCADIAIHDGKHAHDKDLRHIEAQNDNAITTDNPHAHILLTARPINENGFSVKKNREWESPRNVYNWRKNWANAQNREFERKGLEVRVSHESHKKRGLDREPTIHHGHKVTALERQGVKTRIGDINREIVARNRARTKYGNIISSNADTRNDSNSKNNNVQVFKQEKVIFANSEPTANVNKPEVQSEKQFTPGAVSPEERRILWQIKDLQSLDKTIQGYDRKIADLQSRLGQLKPLELKNKAHLSEQIRHVENSKNQAVNSLERDHALKPQEIGDRIQELRQQAERFKQQQLIPTHEKSTSQRSNEPQSVSRETEERQQGQPSRSR